MPAFIPPSAAVATPWSSMRRSIWQRRPETESLAGNASVRFPGARSTLGSALHRVRDTGNFRPDCEYEPTLRRDLRRHVKVSRRVPTLREAARQDSRRQERWKSLWIAQMTMDRI